MDLQSDDLVVMRYSALPFYLEQQEDINSIGAHIINTFSQHSYVADLQNWYADLKDITPETWFQPDKTPKDAGPFVLKGKTNSMKFLWKTHMFAKDWDDMVKVYCRLQDDTYIGQQDIYIRKYIPLHTYFVGINDLAITKEFRFFICNKTVISGGFYWSNSIEDVEEMGFKPDINEVPKEFLQQVIELVGDNIKFYVVDVAQTAEGEWIVIELNDGQMSGLSENNPDELYKNLYEVIND